MNYFLLFFLTALLFSLSCAPNQQSQDFLVTIHTDHGKIKLVLYDSTPIHKKNFIKLAKSGAYDSTIFHRVIQEFMIQGGDLARKPENTIDTDATLPAEFRSKLFHKKGAVAAARQGDAVNPEKRSSICQFYIVQGKVHQADELLIDQNALSQAIYKLPAPERDSIMQNYQTAALTDRDKAMQILYDMIPELEQRLGVTIKKNNYSPDRLKAYTTIGGTPNLDDNYTVFGQVVEGLEVVDKIAALPTNADDSPEKMTYMQVTVEEIDKNVLKQRYSF